MSNASREYTTEPEESLQALSLLSRGSSLSLSTGLPVVAARRRVSTFQRLYNKALIDHLED
jgi:hypothetical protein